MLQLSNSFTNLRYYAYNKKCTFIFRTMKKAYDINKMELKRNMIKLLFFRTEITPGYHLERFKEVDILQCQNKGKQVSGRKFQLIQMNFLRKLSR